MGLDLPISMKVGFKMQASSESGVPVNLTFTLTIKHVVSKLAVGPVRLELNGKVVESHRSHIRIRCAPPQCAGSFRDLCFSYFYLRPDVLVSRLQLSSTSRKFFNQECLLPGRAIYLTSNTYRNRLQPT
jgi:hypothetical protein